MSQGAPRKFSEKIAIMERKQNEDQEAFTSVMRDVRAITSSSLAAQQPVCSSPSGLAPPMQWNRPGGSLPNVHEMVRQPTQSWPFWPDHAPPLHSRNRSSATHYHPYKPNKPQELALSPFDYYAHAPGNHLQPPNMIWSNFYRARSDPTIHMNLYNTRPVNLMTNHELSMGQHFQSVMPQIHTSETHQFMGTQKRTMKNEPIVNSLPNIAGQRQQYNYHEPISQRHSTTICQSTLATPNSMHETQSAPTSPSQSLEMPTSVSSWPPRNYSNSPEALEIPNIVLTGTDGQLDCFQDLQDLHLDANELQQLLSSEQVDPACETQLLD